MMDEDTHRRAKIMLHPRDIEALLGLQGMRVVAVQTEHDPLALAVYVEGDNLEPVLRSCQVPALYGHVQTESVNLVGRFTRWVHGGE
jgi:hypothetical protein